MVAVRTEAIELIYGPHIIIIMEMIYSYMKIRWRDYTSCSFFFFNQIIRLFRGSTSLHNIVLPSQRSRSTVRKCAVRIK